GISVIDLNGFGQGTGDPTFDFTYTSFPKGNTNFPNNPNVKLQGTSVFPPLFPGTCTVDGGSQGVFTLTRDSSLATLLLGPPLVTTVGDMMIGHSLDLVFNNAQSPAGCQSGGGNVCALTGLKVQEGGNAVSLAPHPNPPPLTFPPLCIQPFIGVQEPTSVYTMTALALTNLLQPGNPLGNPLQGVPPSGILAASQNAFFVGPDRPGTPLNACLTYQYRQQIGHFLYLVDRARREVVVINSNRFTVLERISLPDPVDLAMGPNLDFLAVSNQKAGAVSIVDIDPSSGTFHQVLKTVPVGQGPRGIAWDPGNEDILVCNELDDTLSVISAKSLQVRKVAKAHLDRPFDVCITQRQYGFGYNRNVYFGWILNRNGDLTLFESGPNGINGWGYDDTIGVAPFKLEKPKRIAVDPSFLGGAVWIAHENPLDPNGSPSGVVGGAVTNVRIDSAVTGVLPLTGFNFFINPQFRDLTLQVKVSIGPDQLTGIPSDLALDDQVNVGAAQNFFTSFSSGLPTKTSGKSSVRGVPFVSVTPAKSERFLFVAVPSSSEGPGAVDVIALGTGYLRYDTDPYLSGVQSIPAPGATVLADYWRQ
ncbi:MAG TPA: hypothetical protein VMS76_03915, partial [Planctomycetota bacterium]|nr:hypothetical protein [Planctomycetota bacterium]